MGRKRGDKAPFLAYGGTYLKTRAGRARPRPLTYHHSMHFVLRSSVAKGPWSFRTPTNYTKIEKILRNFAAKHGVTLLNFAIHLNHLHLHVKFPRAQSYKRFIRAASSAIAMAVTGASRWAKTKNKLWDRRPFSRPVIGERARLTVDDYIEINKWESIGYNRAQARFKIAWENWKKDRWRSD
ncbi:MAG: transposase [Bdellovibrionota bacterium]